MINWPPRFGPPEPQQQTRQMQIYRPPPRRDSAAAFAALCCNTGAVSSHPHSHSAHSPTTCVQNKSKKDLTATRSIRTMPPSCRTSSALATDKRDSAVQTAPQWQAKNAGCEMIAQPSQKKRFSRLTACRLSRILLAPRRPALRRIG